MAEVFKHERPLFLKQSERRRRDRRGTLLPAATVFTTMATDSEIARLAEKIEELEKTVETLEKVAKTRKTAKSTDTHVQRDEDGIHSLSFVSVAQDAGYSAGSSKQN